MNNRNQTRLRNLRNQQTTQQITHNQPLNPNGDLFHQPCCFGGDPDEACGYPPKTVRAIISVTIVVLSFVTFVFLAIKEKYTEAMGVAGLISSSLSGVIGYYFGSKQAKPPHELTQIEESSYEEPILLDQSPNSLSSNHQLQEQHQEPNNSIADDHS